MNRGSPATGRPARVEEGPLQQAMQALERRIWAEYAGAGRWQRRGLQLLRLAWAVGRDIAAGLLTLRAMSLVYTTLLSLVPLLAVSFSVLKAFGVHNQIEPFLLQTLEPLGERRAEIAARIVDFVDNVQVGVLGSVGILLLFYTVVSLLQKIEDALNDVWQVSTTRSFGERVKDYLSVVVVGPVLVFASLGLSAALMAAPLTERVLGIQPLGWLVDLLSRLVPIGLTALAFSFLYVYVPHTRVRFGAAISGGFVAALLWTLLGWIFAGFVAGASKYEVIYSGFATPILFMIWLYVGWLILLIGATIAFYRQHPEYLAGRRIATRATQAERELIALHVVRLVGQRFYANAPPPDIVQITERLQVPADLLDAVLEPLERCGLLVPCEGPSSGYLPARPWESATVQQVLQALREAGPEDRPGQLTQAEDAAVDAVVRRHAEAIDSAFGGLTLKQFVTEAGDSR